MGKVARRAVGVPRGQVGNLRGGSPRGLPAGVLEATCLNHVPLTPCDILISFLIASFSQPGRPCLHTQGAAGEKQVSSSGVPRSCGSWELAPCAPCFPSGDVITDDVIPKLCHFLGGAANAANSFFYSLMASRTLCLGRLDFCQVPSTHGCLPQAAPSWCSPAGAERGCGRQQAPAGSTPHQGSVFPVPGAWQVGAETPPGSLRVWCRIPQLAQMCFCSGMDSAFLAKRGTQGGLSYAAVMLMSRQQEQMPSHWEDRTHLLHTSPN